jgi:hypothetical protein
MRTEKSRSSRYIDKRFSDPIRALALPAISEPIADRQYRQRLLLNGPHQIDLWLQFDQSSRGDKEEESPPKPLVVVTRHTAKAIAKSIDQLRVIASSVPSSGDSLSPGTTRPNQLRFHLAVSSEAQSELSLLVAERLALAATNQQQDVLDSLVIDLVEPLAPQHPAGAEYGLCHWAYKQERFLVAPVALAKQADNLLAVLDLLGRMLFTLDWLADLGIQLSELCQMHGNQSCSWSIQVSGNKRLSIDVGEHLSPEVGY